MTQDEYVVMVSIAVGKYFPKGVAKERGEALAMLAELFVDLQNKGVIEK